MKSKETFNANFGRLRDSEPGRVSDRDQEQQQETDTDTRNGDMGIPPTQRISQVGYPICPSYPLDFSVLAS